MRRSSGTGTYGLDRAGRPETGGGGLALAAPGAGGSGTGIAETASLDTITVEATPRRCDHQEAISAVVAMPGQHLDRRGDTGLHDVVERKPGAAQSSGEKGGIRAIDRRDPDATGTGPLVNTTLGSATLPAGAASA